MCDGNTSWSKFFLRICGSLTLQVCLASLDYLKASLLVIKKKAGKEPSSLSSDVQHLIATAKLKRSQSEKESNMEDIETKMTRVEESCTVGDL